MAKDLADVPIDAFQAGLSDDRRSLDQSEEIWIPDKAVRRLSEFVSTGDVSGNEVGHAAGPIGDKAFLVDDENLCIW